MLKQVIGVLFASSLGLAACGGGDGGGSGVDGSKDILSLSDAEIVDICEYSESLISASTEADISCRIDGIFAAQEGGDCEAVYTACVAEFEPDPSDCATAADDEIPACFAMVTVGELEGCLSAQAAQTNNINISCATTPEELNTLFEQPLPTACESIQTKCPDDF